MFFKFHYILEANVLGVFFYSGGWILNYLIGLAALLHV